MTPYLAHASQPLEACAELVALDIEAYAPAAVDSIRPPKVHKWAPKVWPLLPVCVLVVLSPHQWHEARGIIRTVRSIDPREWQRSVLPFIAKAQADFDDRMARIKAGECLARYQPGDALNIIGGPFTEFVAKFVRINEAAEFPTIDASVTMFGREVVLPFDARHLQAGVA